MHSLNPLLKALRAEISGARALDTATTVARYNRIVGSSDYAAIAHRLCDQLASYGLDAAHVESFPIDGKITYMGRAFGPAWEPHSARLTVVAGQNDVPEEYVIADFATTPMCLPSGCPTTDPAGVRAEVVDVGAGDCREDYADIDVTGKAVLATGLTTDVYNLAVEEFGAACVLTTNMYAWSNLPGIKRTMVDLPDATHLARLYYDADKQRPAPVFSIPYRQSERLRALARNGLVMVHATVDTETQPGELLVVVGEIAGQDRLDGDGTGEQADDQEVWLVAHLCHPKPGACDNGSGVALAVELFRSIATLIDNEILARPCHTLRLLLLPEMSGTQAYMDRHQERMDRVAAVINLDMVGADYATTEAYCRLVQTPWSRPSFLNRLGAYVLEAVSLGSHSHVHNAPVRNWLYAVAPYDKGSDHDVTLNSIFAIPSVFFFYWPYRYYHTDHDTADKLDPAEFERVGIVAGTMAWVAAAMDSGVARDLLHLIHTEARRDLSLLGHGLSQGLNNTASTHERLWSMGQREQDVLASVLNALPAVERNELADEVAIYQADLAELAQSGYAQGENSQDWRIPTRLEAWPLNLGKLQRQATHSEQRIRELRAQVDEFDDKAIQVFNYTNGTRTIAELARLVSGELGPFPVDAAADFFELLDEAGMIELCVST